MQQVKVKIKKLDDRAVIPAYAHGPTEDAGMDMCAIEEAILIPGVPTAVRTGIAIELPPGYEAQVRGRSGLGLKHGIRIAQGVGTIDPSYRGEIKGLLVWDGHGPNVVRTYDGKWMAFDGSKLPWCVSLESDMRYRILPGDKIMQLIIAQYAGVEWEEAELGESTRGVNGFGSTGVSV